jgi:hypothetical protein
LAAVLLTTRHHATPLVALLSGDLLDQTYVLQASGGSVWPPYIGYSFLRADEIFTYNNVGGSGAPLYQEMRDDNYGVAKLAPQSFVSLPVLNYNTVLYDIGYGSLVLFDPLPLAMDCATERRVPQGPGRNRSLMRTIKKRRVQTAGVTAAANPGRRAGVSFRVRYDDVNRKTYVYAIAGSVKVCPRLSSWAPVVLSSGSWLEVGDTASSPVVHP